MTCRLCGKSTCLGECGDPSMMIFHDPIKPTEVDICFKRMTAWGFLQNLHQVCSFQTKEGKKVGKATNSELKRWIQNKALIINGETVDWNEEIDFPLISVVLFPKKPITLL